MGVVAPGEKKYKLVYISYMFQPFLAIFVEVFNKDKYING